MRLPGKGMSWKEFFAGLKAELSKDNVTDWAAAVTYSGVLALFPFLLFLVALASVVIEPSDAEVLVQQLAQVAPPEVTKILGDRIRDLGKDTSIGLLTVGALGAVWAASGGIQAVMRALNVAYDVKEGRPFWKVKGIAIAMTIFSSVLALVAALVAIASPAVAELVGGPVGTAITWLRLPAAGLVMMLLWAVIYYVLPDVEQEFKFITPGSVGGVIVWVLASYAFSKYVANFGKYDATYGSLGGIIVMLLWIWISALVLLVGAEVNALIEHRSAEGKREGAKSMDDTGTTPKRGRARADGMARGRDDERPGRGGDRAPREEANGRPEGGHPRFDLLSLAALGAGAVLRRRRRSGRGARLH